MLVAVPAAVVHHTFLCVFNVRSCLLQASKQRPRRHFDQNIDVTGTSWLPAVLAPLHLLDSRGVSYRLDVELGKLEFEVHPYMTLERQLVRGRPVV